MASRYPELRFYICGLISIDISIIDIDLVFYLWIASSRNLSPPCKPTGDVVPPSALTSLLHCPLCPRLTCCCCLISLFIRTLYPARASNTHTKSLTAELQLPGDFTSVQSPHWSHQVCQCYDNFWWTESEMSLLVFTRTWCWNLSELRDFIWNIRTSKSIRIIKLCNKVDTTYRCEVMSFKYVKY